MFKVVVACVVAALVWCFALTRHPRARVQVAVMDAATGVEPARLLRGAVCDWGSCAGGKVPAYKRWILNSGALDACAHHANEKSEKLDAIAVYFIDELWAV